MASNPASSTTQALFAALWLLAPVAAGAETGSRGARLAAWSPDYAGHCLLEGAATDPADPRAELQDLVAALSGRGALSGYLAEILATSDIVLCLDPRPPGCRGYFEPASGVLALKPRLDLP